MADKIIKEQPMKNNGNITKDVESISAPTRELVESLLKAQEEQ